MPAQAWTCKTCKAKYPTVTPRDIHLNNVKIRRVHPGKSCAP